MDMKDRGFYHEIVQGLWLPSEAFIDGSYQPSASGSVITTTNPANGEVLSTVAHCQAEDVDRAVACARRAFLEGKWSRAAPEERKRVLLRLSDLIRAHSEELAVLEGLDSGKPIRDCLREISIEV